MVCLKLIIIHDPIFFFSSIHSESTKVFLNVKKLKISVFPAFYHSHTAM